MRLTTDLLEEACQFVNPLKERELDLRGYKIQVIENLAATFDQVSNVILRDQWQNSNPYYDQIALSNYSDDNYYLLAILFDGQLHNRLSRLLVR